MLEIIEVTRKTVRFINRQRNLEIASIRKSSKELTCPECGRPIRKGEYYISDKIRRTTLKNRRSGGRPFKILEKPFWQTKPICRKCGRWFLQMIAQGLDSGVSI